MNAAYAGIDQLRTEDAAARPRMLLMQPGVSLAVEEGASEVGPDTSPVVQDDRLGHIANSSSADDHPPRQLDVRSEAERVIEPAVTLDQLSGDREI